MLFKKLFQMLTHFSVVILRHMQHLWVTGKHAGGVDHNSLLILCVKHLHTQSGRKWK